MSSYRRNPDNLSTSNRHTKSSSFRKRQSNETPEHYNRHYYISPLEKLDKLSKRYTPKKVEENNKLKKLYEKGECTKFELSTSLFEQFYINHTTPMNILDDLMDYAQYIQEYTIDTEGQLKRPPQPSEPALIQIQFIHEKDPSIILLVETLHLPPENSSKFNKIKQLCQKIFSRNHVVNCWGDPKKELKEFIRFNILNNNDIYQIKPKNIQNKFKGWFNSNYPQSAHRKNGSNDKYSLQSAIHLTFNEWLDKRMTLANWGCGIDLSLNTYVPTNTSEDQKHQIIQDEKEIRQLMGVYAMNDCFSVTKLAYITKLYESSPTPSHMSEDEETETLMQEQELFIKDNNKNDGIAVHVLDEQYVFYDIIELDEPDPNILFTVHEQYDISNQLENISEDEEQPLGKKEPSSDNKILPLFETNTRILSHPSLTKTQRNNKKKKKKRYRFEIIRQVYERFTITNIKRILTDMNIYWVNINIVGRTLFIGMKNENIRQRVEELLHEDMFTKEHYQRILKRYHRK